MTAHQVEALYNQWLKETNRGGSVLLGKSIREFFEWLKSKTVDLEKLQDKFDALFEKETAESFNQWLEDKQKTPPKHKQ